METRVLFEYGFVLRVLIRINLLLVSSAQGRKHFVCKKNNKRLFNIRRKWCQFVRKDSHLTVVDPGFLRRSVVPISEVRAKNYYLTRNFCIKQRENERNCTKGGRIPSTPMDPPMPKDLYRKISAPDSPPSHFTHPHEDARSSLVFLKKLAKM